MSEKRNHPNRGSHSGGDPNEPQQTAEELQEDNRIYGAKVTLSTMGLDGRTLTNPTFLSKIGQKPGDPPPIAARMYGQLRGVTEVKMLPRRENDHRPDEALQTRGLVGQIEGVNMISGEVHAGGVTYMPSGFHDMFMSQVNAIIERSDGGSVDFALEFWAQPDGNPSGFTWKARNLLPVSPSDPLATLRGRALKGLTGRTVAGLLPASGNRGVISEGPLNQGAASDNLGAG